MRGVPWLQEQSWKGVHWEPAGTWPSPELTARAGTDYAMFRTPRGECSCGSFNEPSQIGEVDVDHERQKMRRKGWSANKIEKAIQQSLATHARRTGESGGFQFGIVPSAIEIAAHLGECGLIAEWLGGKDARHYDRSLEVVVDRASFGRDESFDHRAGRLIWLRRKT